jgi:uncharacterized protein (DUF4415 family)
MNISQQRLKEIAAIPDDKIDTSEIPELDDNFWQDARFIVPESKKLIHFCIEKDVFEWFAQFGDDYQNRMNAALRDYIEAHRILGND